MDEQRERNINNALQPFIIIGPTSSDGFADFQLGGWASPDPSPQSHPHEMNPNVGS